MFSTKIFVSHTLPLFLPHPSLCLSLVLSRSVRRSKIKLWKCNNKITVPVRAVALKCERNYISVEWLHKQISINALTNSVLSQEKWAGIDRLSAEMHRKCTATRRSWYYALKMRVAKILSLFPFLSFSLSLSLNGFFSFIRTYRQDHERKSVSEARLTSQQSR